MKKIRSKAGETLVETLVSLLIMVLCMGFLVTAVVTATKINEKLSKIDQSFAYDQDSTYAGETIQVGDKTVSVTIEENNGYYYYDYQP